MCITMCLVNIILQNYTAGEVQGGQATAMQIARAQQNRVKVEGKNQIP